jgi:hypothetical protein
MVALEVCLAALVLFLLGVIVIESDNISQLSKLEEPFHLSALLQVF